MILYSLAALWFICSLLAYGFFFAYLQRKYLLIAKQNYAEDMVCCIGLSLAGPIALAVVVFYKFYSYGWKLV